MILRAAFLILTLGALPLWADTLTPARVIRANTPIDPGDIAIAATPVPGALPAGTELSGMEARVTLYPGRPIMPSHIGPAALVIRNQPVTLKYQSGALFIETEARALSRGGVGDMVRVMNLTSRNTVLARVRPDGSVEVANERSTH